MKSHEINDKDYRLPICVNSIFNEKEIRFLSGKKKSYKLIFRCGDSPPFSLQYKEVVRVQKWQYGSPPLPPPPFGASKFCQVGQNPTSSVPAL